MLYILTYTNPPSLSAFRTSRRLPGYSSAAPGVGLGPALRRSRRPAGGSQVLVCMAQEHEGHAERLDPGYRIMEKKKKEKPL